MHGAERRGNFAVDEGEGSGDTVSEVGSGLGDAPSQPAPLAGLLAIFLIALAPLVVGPVAPTIDFYDHVSRYFVLSHVAGDPFLAENYEARWSLLPNIGLDLVGTPLLGQVGALLGAKIILAVIFAVQYGGVLFFNRMLTGAFNLVTAAMAAMLLYSFILRWGFANFLLGLGLLFWGAGLWLHLRRRLWVATAVGVPFAFLIFVTHGVAFALYGLLLGALEIGFLVRRQQGLGRFLAAGVALAAQAVAPAALFLLGPTADAPGGVTNAAGAVTRLKSQGQLAERLFELAHYRLTTIVRVAESGALWFDVVTFVVLGALVVWMLARRKIMVSPLAWPALVIGVLLVALTPPALFGVGYVADRMPLYMAFLVAGVLSVPVSLDKASRLVVAGVCLIAAARIGVMTGDWLSYGADLRDYRAVVERLPPRQVTGFVNVELHPRYDDTRRCEMYGPLMAPERDAAVALFAIPTAQPMRLQGRLSEALKDLPAHMPTKGVEARSYYQAVLQAVSDQRRFDYVLICNLRALGAPLPKGLGVVGEAGRFTLARVGAPTPMSGVGQ